uniref:Uncharacterized protein n=1 Tax=Rhizophora mucronata TaxID=61149 RepID=A0A2P2PY46_RHIMU
MALIWHWISLFFLIFQATPCQMGMQFLNAKSNIICADLRIKIS